MKPVKSKTERERNGEKEGKRGRGEQGREEQAYFPLCKLKAVFNFYVF